MDITCIKGFVDLDFKRCNLPRSTLPWPNQRGMPVGVISMPSVWCLGQDEGLCSGWHGKKLQSS